MLLLDLVLLWGCWEVVKHAANAIREEIGFRPFEIQRFFGISCPNGLIMRVAFSGVPLGRMKFISFAFAALVCAQHAQGPDRPNHSFHRPGLDPSGPGGL